MRTVGWVVLAVPIAMFALGIGGAYLADLIGGDELAESAATLAMILAIPGGLIFLPACGVAIALDRAGRNRYRDNPICACWDVLLEDRVHVISLPAFRVRGPGHAWVDGARAPLNWSAGDPTSSEADLHCGPVSGKLVLDVHAPSTAVAVGVSVVAGVAAIPTLACRLEVQDGMVSAVPVSNGRRAS